MSNLDELKAAEADFWKAQEAKEEAERLVEEAEERVATAKAKIACDDAPKLVGKAYKWVDPDGNSRHSSFTLVTGIKGDRVLALSANEGGITEADISLRTVAPDEFLEREAWGFNVEIERSEFDAEYERVLTLLGRTA